jgi:large subunit ribosomal protein L4
MELEVLNIKGEKTGRSIQLSDEIFSVEPNDHVVYLDVKRYMNNQRQGTHKAKERNEVAGSTKKLRKQKGGGGARIGSITSPVLRGGGRIFGPRPRNYEIKLNKKVKAIARRSALTYKAQSNDIIVLENFDFGAPKTKDYLNILNALNLNEKRSLLLINDKQDNIIRSARNLPNASVGMVNELNTYSIMHANTILVTEAAIQTLNETLK